MEMKEILEKIEKHELDVDTALSLIGHQEYCIDYERKQRKEIKKCLRIMFGIKFIIWLIQNI